MQCIRQSTKWSDTCSSCGCKGEYQLSEMAFTDSSKVTKIFSYSNSVLATAVNIEQLSESESREWNHASILRCTGGEN